MTTPLDWNQHLATCCQGLKRSAVREMLKVAVRPEVISFAGGLPAPECFPRELIARVSAGLLDADHGPKTLQYGESEGLFELREHLAASVDRPVEEVMITSGAQQGLDLLGRVLLEPGDVVAVENPTYLGALGAWRPHQVRFAPLPIDQDGLCVDALEALLAKGRLKFLYTMHNFHNPAGAVLSLERRERLITLAEKHALLILEDDPYGDLRYDGEPLPSLLALAASRGVPDRVVHLRSFSKVVAPGLRVGWLTAPAPLHDALVKMKQAADFHPNMLGQRLMLEVVRDVSFPEHVSHLRQVYGARRDAMDDAVRDAFPEGTRWSTPQGGMFLMAQLPSSIDASASIPQALERQVAYVSIDHFTVDGSGKDAVRLNFSNASPDRIREGIGRLGELFRSLA